MAQSLTATNDRLRATAYAYFEHNVDAQILPRLLDALPREESEFVRPALTRALAAYGTDAKVRDVLNGLVMKGQDFFRSGDHRGRWATTRPHTRCRRSRRSPSSMVPCRTMRSSPSARSATSDRSRRSRRLQRTAPKNLQPSIAAASACSVSTARRTRVILPNRCDSRWRPPVTRTCCAPRRPLWRRWRSRVTRRPRRC